MTTDGELLKRYWRETSEEAFCELVQRYLPMVFPTALRQLNGDRHLAEDVVQKVMMALAHNAKKLHTRNSVAAWLYKTTRFLAGKAVRTETRRKHWEREATFYFNTPLEPAIDWSRALPLLDECLEQLREKDREVLLLRYSGENDFNSISRIMGLSEMAARKRVERALGKLRAKLETRGLNTTQATLATMLGGVLVTSVPLV